MRNDMDIFRPSLFHPLREWDSLQRGMNNLFTNYFGENESRIRNFDFAPSCDIEESEKYFLVTLDLPGVQIEDVKAEVQNNTLTISGERRAKEENKKGSRHVMERSSGSFFRSFSLPMEIDSSKVEAAFENGELKIMLPKSEVVKTQQLKIGKSLSLPKAEKDPLKNKM